MTAPTPKYLFIIGAPRCGTTAIANQLGAQPGFFLPKRKEPCFFTDFGERTWAGPKGKDFAAHLVTSWADYQALYTKASPDQWRIDASTDYLSNNAAPARIASLADTDDIRIVCILRDPVKRMFSEYGLCKRMMLEPLDFIDSIKFEKNRIDEAYPPFFYHVQRSKYTDGLKRYFNRFGKSKIKIFIFENHTSQDEIISSICDFAGVEYCKIKDPFRKSESFSYKSTSLNRMLRKDNSARAFIRKIVPDSIRKSIWRYIYRFNTIKETMTEKELLYALNCVQEERDTVAALTGLDTSRWSHV